jgi:uracil-DNA glycosylase
LLDRTGTPPAVNNTYLSYLYMCVPDGEPTEADYGDLERFFDSELRAITAHVLLPVGERATRHTLENYTARRPALDMDALHATELRGSGFLVYPIKNPREWTEDDEAELVATLTTLQQRDYRREVDLGRFLPGDEPYFVR